MRKKPRKAFIIEKGYGRSKRFIYYPLDDAQDINLEPLTIRRVMKQIQIELLKPVEFHTAFGKKSYQIGIHSVDRDLARLLVNANSARYLLPIKEVLEAKQGRH